MLLIMLIITPRTFFVGGVSGRSGLMSRRGMISGATGGGSVIGVGTRPWLQKVAALTVAVSLTLATADTFKIAARQYDAGYIDAIALRNLVVSSTEIKVSRIVSDVFLWLAQVQTLIRLFPRHKEKVIIKWAGFALILLDMIFSCLNSFGPYQGRHRPRHFETAIPALSYLFTLSLSMLYAAWVMYYAITKRRYAFYHSLMWNIALVALLSIIAILTPVVFFITDIANDSIAGWGDYFRWVGAAAASVIVWEWVERIEALEREERKDGILGREIYDGDDMLETTPSHEVWPNGSHKLEDAKKPGSSGRGGGFGSFASGAGYGYSSLTHRFGKVGRQVQALEPSRRKRRSIHIDAPPRAHHRPGSGERPPQQPRIDSRMRDAPPVPTIGSPVSREGTTSPESTVYTIKYHPICASPAAVNNVRAGETQPGHPLTDNERRDSQAPQDISDDIEKGGNNAEDGGEAHTKTRWIWHIANPFRRGGRSPPAEVQRGRVIEPLGIDDVATNIPQRHYAGLALKDRLGTFAAQQGEKLRSKRDRGQPSDADLPVTIIPAQPRGRTWSPQQDAIVQEQLAVQPDRPGSLDPRPAVFSTVSVAEESTSNGSEAQPMDARRFGASLENTSTASCIRTPHVRFTPEALGKPIVDRQQTSPANDSIAQSPTGALGTEVFDFQPGSEPIRGYGSSSTHGHQTPTNHER
jgi:hypothetical protein